MKYLILILCTVSLSSFGKTPEDGWQRIQLGLPELTGSLSGFKTTKDGFRIDEDDSRFETNAKLVWQKDQTEMTDTEISLLCKHPPISLPATLKISVQFEGNPYSSYLKLIEKESEDGYKIENQNQKLLRISSYLVKAPNSFGMRSDSAFLQSMDAQIGAQYENYMKTESLTLNLTASFEQACAIQTQKANLGIQFEIENDSAKSRRISFLSSANLRKLAFSVLDKRITLSKASDSLILNVMRTAEEYRSITGLNLTDAVPAKSVALVSGIVDVVSGRPYQHTDSSLSDLSDRLDDFKNYRTTSRINLLTKVGK